jgi:hypothetical protein
LTEEVKASLVLCSRKTIGVTAYTDDKNVLQRDSGLIKYDTETKQWKGYHKDGTFIAVFPDELLKTYNLKKYIFQVRSY